MSAGKFLKSTRNRGEFRHGGNEENGILDHQKRLFEKLQQHGLERFKSGEKVKGQESSYRMKKYESYKKDSQLPSRVRDLKVMVDGKNETVLVPIYGIAVPFHIATLKSVYKAEEGDSTVLRFNFVTPGQPGSKKDASMMPEIDEPNVSFIRSLSVKSADNYRFGEIYNAVNELKKQFQKREDQRREMADLVQQGAFQELRGKRPLKLNEVSIRPALEGKRVPGSLEIHQNGVRYVEHLKSDRSVEVLFSNIKHLFMQSCQGENIVLIHVQLKHDIIVGQRKTQHLQWYREVTNYSVDETGNRRRRVAYGDEDELLAEQEERRHRARLDREFKQFADQIAEASNGLLKVDVPFRDLGFEGVPFRQKVLLAPTVDCLVSISEPPFLVITLDDIEIVNLERVAHGLQEFDMVVVFSDFSRPPVAINAIPHQALTGIKEWLDNMDKVFFENPVNLNWREIMKAINEDPKAFFEDGGWSFLQQNNSDEDASESASEFEVESDELEESSSESDFSAESSGSSDYDSEESGEESGEDWDELDRKAIAEEQAKKRRINDEARHSGSGVKSKKMRH